MGKKHCRSRRPAHRQSVTDLEVGFGETPVYSERRLSGSHSAIARPAPLLFSASPSRLPPSFPRGYDDLMTTGCLGSHYRH